MNERPRSRRWLLMIEWMTLASFALAVLGFLGFTNWGTIDAAVRR